jgi:hypothetical protein
MTFHGVRNEKKFLGQVNARPERSGRLKTDLTEVNFI